MKTLPLLLVLMTLSLLAQADCTIHDGFSSDGCLPNLIIFPSCVADDLVWDRREDAYSEGPGMLVEGFTDPGTIIKYTYQDIHDAEVPVAPNGYFADYIYFGLSPGIGIEAIDAAGNRRFGGLVCRSMRPPVPDIEWLNLGKERPNLIAVAVGAYSIEDFVWTTLLIDGEPYAMTDDIDPAVAGLPNFFKIFSCKLPPLAPGRHELVPKITRQFLDSIVLGPTRYLDVAVTP